MSHDAEARLAELGIELPSPNAPAANYVPAVRSGNLVFLAGQISVSADTRHEGKLGDRLTVDQGQAAARLCAINIISALKAELGSLDKVVRIVKLTGFVNATPDFTDAHLVLNGASNLLVEVFGDAGRHARSAVGAPTLPMGVAVEIEAIVEFA